MYHPLEDSCMVKFKRWLYGESAEKLYERRRNSVKRTLRGSVTKIRRGDAYYYDRYIVVVIKRLSREKCLIVAPFSYGPVTNNKRCFKHIFKIADLGSRHV